MTLSSTAEGAHKQMETYLDQMVDFIIGFLKDQVKWLIIITNKYSNLKSILTPF